MTYCQNCHCEITSTDYEVGECTQCGFEIEIDQIVREESDGDDVHD